MSKKTKRKQILEEARQVFPEEFFLSIKTKTLDHKENIRRIMTKNKTDIILARNNYPNLFKFMKERMRDIQGVEWGLVSQLYYRLRGEYEWCKLPAMLRFFSHKLATSINYHHLLTFQIFSMLGWREGTKFFEPYQIWVFGYPEQWQKFDPKYDIEGINYNYIWYSSFIELVDRVRKLIRNISNYSIMTDGRKIAARKDYHAKFSFPKGQNHKAMKLLQDIVFNQKNLDIPTEFKWICMNNI